MDVFTPDVDGMIRLEELGTQQPEGANLTLAIVATDAENAVSGGSSKKGKGKMTEQPLKRKLYLDFEIGSGSGNEEIDVGNGQQPDFEADEFGIQGNNELVQVQAMGHLVRVVVGEWQRLAHGTWRFDMDHTQVKYDIVLRENETYGDLVAMVRGKYRVLPSAPVALTYDFPEWMKVHGDYTTPPVDILEDKDV
ncbi:hypothetical protein DY000_02025362 [Brassica cretica]|uniref:Uncharacterized protein n=1 Tax=Brassica cretica TaxID=69181 RepID=A0ABQ7E578_BRACR|nr:hypothetical protein DY000_02025362 [Brassica cretica]